MEKQTSELLAEYFCVCGLEKTTLTPNRYRRDSEIDLSPITDIRVASLATIPDNYTVIYKTSFGNNGCVNSGSGSFLEAKLYVCVTRIRASRPLTGLCLVNKDKIIPPGFVEMPNTILKSTTKSIGLACCTSPKEGFVMDVMVVNVTLGETCPRGYKIVSYANPASSLKDNSINPSAIGGDCVVLAVRYDNPSTEVVFEPSLLSHYPKASPNMNFPDGVASFCFPLGIKLSTVPLRPLFSTFVITTITGQEIYGSCVTITEIEQEEKRDDISECEMGAFHSNETITPLTRKSSHTTVVSASTPQALQKQPERSYFTPLCYCLLSKFPHYQSFRSFLSFLVRISMKSNMKISVENFIAYFLTIPLPNAGIRAHIHLKLCHDNLNNHLMHPTSRIVPKRDTCCHFMLNHQSACALPSTPQISMTCLLRCLSSEMIAEIFSCILAERKIVFIGSSVPLIHKIVDSFRIILFPLAWKYTCIIVHVFFIPIVIGVPILPRSMRAILQTFLPFIVGIHSSLRASITLPSDIVLVDLDLPRIENNFLIRPITHIQNLVSNKSTKVTVGSLFKLDHLQSSFLKHEFIEESSEVPSHILPLRFLLPLISRLEELRNKITIVSKEFWSKKSNESETEYKSWIESEFMEGSPLDSVDALKDENLPRSILLDRHVRVDETGKGNTCLYCHGEMEDKFIKKEFDSDEFNLAIRAIFLQTMVSLIGNYRLCLRKKPSQRGSVIFTDYFDTKKFKSYFNDDCNDFIEQLISTQALQHFLFQVSNTSDENILYFDACIAAAASKCSKPVGLISNACFCSGFHDSFSLLKSFIFSTNISFKTSSKYAVSIDSIVPDINFLPGATLGRFINIKRKFNSDLLFPPPVEDSNILSKYINFARNSMLHDLHISSELELFLSFYANIFGIASTLVENHRNYVAAVGLPLTALASPCSTTVSHNFAPLVYLFVCYAFFLARPKYIPKFPFSLQFLEMKSVPLISKLGPRGSLKTDRKNSDPEDEIRLRSKYYTNKSTLFSVSAISFSKSCISVTSSETETAPILSRITSNKRIGIKRGFDFCISELESLILFEDVTELMSKNVSFAIDAQSASIAVVKHWNAMRSQVLLLYSHMLRHFCAINPVSTEEVYLALLNSFIRSIRTILHKNKNTVSDRDHLNESELDQYLIEEKHDKSVLSQIRGFVPISLTDYDISNDIEICKDFVASPSIWATFLSLSISLGQFPHSSLKRIFAKSYFVLCKVCKFLDAPALGLDVYASLCDFQTTVESVPYKPILPMQFFQSEFHLLYSTGVKDMPLPIVLASHSICSSCHFRLSADDILTSWMDQQVEELTTSPFCSCPVCGMETHTFLNVSALSSNGLSNSSKSRNKISFSIKNFQVPFYSLQQLVHCYKNFLPGFSESPLSPTLLPLPVLYSLLFHFTLHRLPSLFLFKCFVRYMPMLFGRDANKFNSDFYHLAFLPHQYCAVTINESLLSYYLASTVVVPSDMSGNSVETEHVASEVSILSYSIVENAWQSCQVCSPFDLVFIMKSLLFASRNSELAFIPTSKFGSMNISLVDVHNFIKIRSYLSTHKLSEAVQVFLRAREQCPADLISSSFFHGSLFFQLLCLRHTLEIAPDLESVDMELVTWLKFEKNECDLFQSDHFPCFGFVTNKSEPCLISDNIYDRTFSIESTFQDFSDSGKEFLPSCFLQSNSLRNFGGAFFQIHNSMFIKTFTMSLGSIDSHRHLLLVHDKIPSINHITSTKMLSQNIIALHCSRDPTYFPSPMLKKQIGKIKIDISEVFNFDISSFFISPISVEEASSIAIPIVSMLHLPRALTLLINCPPPSSILSIFTRVMLMNGVSSCSQFEVSTREAQITCAHMTLPPMAICYSDSSYREWMVEFIKSLSKTSLDFSCDIGLILDCISFIGDAVQYQLEYSQAQNLNKSSCLNSATVIFEKYFSIENTNLSDHNPNFSSEVDALHEVPIELLGNYVRLSGSISSFWPDELVENVRREIFVAKSAPKELFSRKVSSDPLLGIVSSNIKATPVKARTVVTSSRANKGSNEIPSTFTVSEPETFLKLPEPSPDTFSACERVASKWLDNILSPLLSELAILYQLLLMNRESIPVAPI